MVGWIVLGAGFAIGIIGAVTDKTVVQWKRVFADDGTGESWEVPLDANGKVVSQIPGLLVIIGTVVAVVGLLLICSRP